jgi:MarR family transcriptional regulator, transcriptional regulator for hemolysin
MGATTEVAAVQAATPESEDQMLCWLLSRASYTLGTEMMAGLEVLGISPRAHQVLCAAMRGQHTQTELARMVGLDKTTMVVTIDELEAAGLAERRPSKEDRRVRVIAVTEAGRAVWERGSEIVSRVQADVLGVLPEADRAIFLDSLLRLVRGRLSEPVECAHPVRRRSPRT